jgi:glycine cleavage system H protein
MSVNSGDAVLLVESLRDSLIIKAPFPGVIIDINKNCADTPDLLNNDPYGEGWLFLLSPDDVYDFELQMQSDEYEYMVIKEKEDLDFF